MQTTNRQHYKVQLARQLYIQYRPTVHTHTQRERERLDLTHSLTMALHWLARARQLAGRLGLAGCMFQLLLSQAVTLISSLQQHYTLSHRPYASHPCRGKGVRSQNLHWLSTVQLVNWHLTFLARDSIYAIARYMPSPVRLSVCLSHGWISQRGLKLGSRNLHHRVAPWL